MNLKWVRIYFKIPNIFNELYKFLILGSNVIFNHQNLNSMPVTIDPGRKQSLIL
jgi:hypothetical protein